MNTLAHKHRNWKKKLKLPLRREQKDPYNFEKDFPCASTIKDSVSLFVEDQLRALYLEPDTTTIKDLCDPLYDFIETFYQEMFRRQSSDAVKDFASLCKARESDFHDFLYLILDGFEKSSDVFNNLFILDKRGEEFGISLSDFKYLPSSFKGLFLKDVNSEQMDNSYVYLSKNPRFYIYLYRYAISMLSYCIRNGIEDLASQKVAYLFLVADSIGTLWRQINESGNPAKLVADKLMATLTGEPGTPSKEFWELFNSVVEDLDLQGQHRNHPKYVQEFREAYRSWVDSGDNSRPFTNQDYYCALRGSTSRYNLHKKYKSLVSSLFETDPFRSDPVVEAFDKYIGYHSGYNKEFKHPLSEDKLFLTLFVNNPNKDDPRGIHEGTNSIQDRCSWLHYRTQSFLYRLTTDCMRKHENGVQFLCRITSRNYRRMHHNDVVNSDFSSATDNLSPIVQEAVIGILFPQCVVDFWHYVSNYPKNMKYPDGTVVPYNQTRGQPQGLRGSFDFFSLFHHIAMLMTMKKTGRENILASDFYRILGDDSVINTVTEDPLEEVSESYGWICRSADLVFSDGKVFHSHYQDQLPTYVSDFAKVTVRDGTMLSKVPMKLLSSYSTRVGGWGLSTIFWLNTKGCCRRDLLELAKERASEGVLEKKIMLNSIIYSGKIEYLKNFENSDEFKKIPWEISSASLFVYGFKTVQTSMLNFLYSEQEAENMILHPDLFDQAWKEMIPDNQIENLVNQVDDTINHKYFKLMDENETLVNALETLLCCSNLEATMASMVLFTKVAARQAVDLKTIIDDIQLSKVEDADFPMSLYDVGQRYDYYFSRIEHESRVSFNSSRRRSTDPTAIFERLDKSFYKLYEGSTPVIESLRDYVSELKLGAGEEDAQPK